MLVLLADLLVRGTKFKNDLCAHLDTIQGDTSNHSKHYMIFLVSKTIFHNSLMCIFV